MHLTYARRSATTAYVVLAALATLALYVPAAAGIYGDIMPGYVAPGHMPHGSLIPDSLIPDNGRMHTIHESGILEVPPEITARHDLRRVLVAGDAAGAGGVRTWSDGFFSVAVMPAGNMRTLQSQGHPVIPDIMLEHHKPTDAPEPAGITDVQHLGWTAVAPDSSDASRFVGITNAHRASESGYTGNGTVIAIVDTGVDFSNPDIMHAVARDDNGHPVMIDADGQGLIITNTTFYAYIDDNNIVRNYTGTLPENATSSVYVTTDGVFLDVAGDGDGTTVSVYNSFYPIAGDAPVFNATIKHDMRIGTDNRDYIRSASGMYHLGMMYQGALSGPYTRIQVVPVLVTDSHIAGIYDTITPDLSTSWHDYTRSDLKRGEKPDYDFDFTDELPIILGSGNEFLVYDSDGDGDNDYTAGIAGARVLDVYGVMTNGTAHIHDHVSATNGTLLPAMDPDGNYFGVMTDFDGHGTASAATIASAGIQQYDIYNDTRKFSIPGVAPDARILPVKALWLGNTAYAWMWVAGFENDGYNWTATAPPRADIVSNSWGVSTFPNLDTVPGYDILSVLISLLSTPGSLGHDWPGMLMITSAGNSGPGYGTLGLPNASPLGVSVAATTNNVFVGYGPFAGQPRFGNTTDHHGEMADFTSRGPGVIGDPKPDISAPGAYGFVPSSILTMEKESDREPFSLFGGTSMAAPIVAGVSAIITEGLADAGMDTDPYAVRNILMSTASDLHNDPLVQGSGLADAGAAADYIDGRHGMFAVHNDASYKNIAGIINPAMARINNTMLNLEPLGLPPGGFETSSWFGGHLEPDQRSTTIFTVQNPSDEPLEVHVQPQRLEVVQSTSYEGTTKPLVQDRILRDSGTYAPNYLLLEDVKDITSPSSFFDDTASIPENADLLVLNLNFAFDEFMNMTHDIYAEELKIASLYLYDWTDHNNNTKITSDELSLVSRGGSWGTVQELRTGQPASKFQGTPVVGIYPVPSLYSFWIGKLDKNATAINYTLSATYYQHKPWGDVWADTDSIMVPADGQAQVSATIIASPDAQTGVYQGSLLFSTGVHRAAIPVTYAVVVPVDGPEAVYVAGRGPDGVPYGPGHVRGAFDMTSRYMGGDWRTYYFDIRDPAIDAASIRVSWQNPDTSIGVFVSDQHGSLIQSNAPSGVFGHFLGWPSTDWLGPSPFSQGGGFFPVNSGQTFTILHVPVNSTGMHSMMIHSTLFAGNGTTEPVHVQAKFFSISDGEAPFILLDVPPILYNDAEIRPEITDKNLDSVGFTANGTRIYLVNGTLDLSVLDDGFYILDVTASDTAGNTATAQARFTKAGGMPDTTLAAATGTSPGTGTGIDAGITGAGTGAGTGMDAATGTDIGTGTGMDAATGTDIGTDTGTAPGSPPDNTAATHGATVPADATMPADAAGTTPALTQAASMSLDMFVMIIAATAGGGGIWFATRMGLGRAEGS